MIIKYILLFNKNFIVLDIDIDAFAKKIIALA